MTETTTPPPTKEDEELTTTTLQKIKPYIQKISFGSIMGYCTGMVMKKVGKSIGFVVGTTFIGLQVASSLGYINVKWDKVSNTVQDKIDVTNDGTIDEQDVKEYYKKFKSIMIQNIPSASGFTFGFLFGVQYS